jgi:hypothetical protein
MHGILQNTAVTSVHKLEIACASANKDNGAVILLHAAAYAEHAMQLGV